MRNIRRICRNRSHTIAHVWLYLSMAASHTNTHIQICSESTPIKRFIYIGKNQRFEWIKKCAHLVVVCPVQISKNNDTSSEIKCYKLCDKIKDKRRIHGVSAVGWNRIASRDREQMKRTKRPRKWNWHIKRSKTKQTHEKNIANVFAQMKSMFICSVVCRCKMRIVYIQNRAPRDTFQQKHTENELSWEWERKKIHTHTKMGEKRTLKISAVCSRAHCMEHCYGSWVN